MFCILFLFANHFTGHTYQNENLRHTHNSPIHSINLHSHPFTSKSNSVEFNYMCDFSFFFPSFFSVHFLFYFFFILVSLYDIHFHSGECEICYRVLDPVTSIQSTTSNDHAFRVFVINFIAFLNSLTFDPLSIPFIHIVVAFIFLRLYFPFKKKSKFLFSTNTAEE